MTASMRSPVDDVDDDLITTVRVVDLSLRSVADRLRADVSVADVRAAGRTIDEAEQSLALLRSDPWDPSVLHVRQAREILSSHLLAAEACADAELAAPVAARVLRRGADSALRALSNHGEWAEPGLSV